MSDSLLILSQPLSDVAFGLRFTSRADRFGHQLLARCDSFQSDLILFDSVEGDNESQWPPSPPLQDVHQQEIGDQQVIMAVGMAGTSHWSAACSLKENEETVRFHFDMACRVKQTPDWLGSTYQCSGELETADNGSLMGFDFNWKTIEVEQARCQISHDDQRIQLTVDSENRGDNEALSNSPSQTLRWQYLLEIVRKS